ncbi:hypothetical protein TCAL_02259 [Tigriopus californicus]|uniref:Poly A polymerase head domain-containing protein n=2 Tax=Tigriopus californicus TaxID=6832 RepID=A0A553PQH5_TIGCA|nr:CCA tRNA nucleotidyltransferase 1, mitochondrial-like isoform X2 [Tigriopus californicus]TRY79938.1 hypothetical protein TCAL_02259 [Tigriopus californicus]|eukprot:TCALIF_02259-PA protein Name:"Similar to Trnt1 CCA tRNA nucleotidyltransferase 1, mitochondrial (Mus musculus)" AED:0.07 eAED:0.07 QI:185/1/1/1/0.5/0.33/3/247/481
MGRVLGGALLRHCWRPLRGGLVRQAAMKASSSSHTSTSCSVSLAQTPGFKALAENPEVDLLKTLFARHGFPLRLAGGAVRDLLSGDTPQDLDFATTATPHEMKTLFETESIRTINELGEKHGTVTCRINDSANFEVTTLRIDKVTHGRKADVEFTKDWVLDANRRDLTINSMFLDLEGNLYDYFNGAEDLQKRRVAFVGEPERRIQEDFLRILRYFRFFGRISASPDTFEEQTLDAIRLNAAGLAQISGERIWMEWKKIMMGRFSQEIMLQMLDVGLGTHIGLPENPDIDQFKTVVQRAPESHPITRIVALLKDDRDMMQLHVRLKLSAFERDLGLFLVEHRQEFPALETTALDAIRPYQYMIVDHKGKPNDVRTWAEELLKYQGQPDLAKQIKEWDPPRFPISGKILLDKGCPKGVILGAVLRELKEQWKHSGFEATEEDLLQGLDAAISKVDLVALQQKKEPSFSAKKRKREFISRTTD